jgi:hypothetical protein
VVKDLFTVNNVNKFTGMIAIKKRHEIAHPNLTPSTLVKKMYLLVKAIDSTGSKDEKGDIDLFMRMYLAMIGKVDIEKHLAVWRKDDSEGWDQLDEEHVARFALAA